MITTLTLYTALLVMLGQLTFELVQPTDPPLLSVLDSPDEADLDAEIELDTDSLVDNSLDTELLEADSLDAWDEPLLTEFTQSPTRTELSSQLEQGNTNIQIGEFSLTGGLGTAMFDGEGRALTELRDPLGGVAMATFFGTKIEGHRIVFFVDNSGGMQHGGFEMLVEELLKTIERLTPQQRFYVILYSDSVYPLFYPQAANQFIRPTAQNRARLAEWLETVELCVGNSIDEGLAAATAIQPDTLFLLTDGRVNTTRDGRKLDMLLDASQRDFSIHTFGMGTGETTQAARQLREIADANDGQFRIVEISDEMKALARLRRRPYHSKQPGAIWGRQVGSR